MTRGVRWSLLSSVILVALIALAGCSHYMMADREPWRRDAESTCLNAGAVKESPTRVRISSIDGPGACGISYPLKVSSLGDSGPLSYDDESLTPPGSIPNAGPSNSSMPQHWPIAQPNSVQSNSLPPLQSPQSPYSPPPAQSYNARPSYPPPQPYSAQQTYSPPQQTYARSPASQPQYGQPQYGAPQPGAPLSIRAPGIPEPVEEDAESPGAHSYPPNYSRVRTPIRMVRRWVRRAIPRLPRAVRWRSSRRRHWPARSSPRLINGSKRGAARRPCAGFISRSSRSNKSRLIPAGA